MLRVFFVQKSSDVVVLNPRVYPKSSDLVNKVVL